ncbi:MAG: hypothetical protein LUG21_00710 [Clostridiales bacterium]|nr:hypothetical protein [Clostridiales bacterium]
MLYLYFAMIDGDNDNEKFEIIYYSYRKRMIYEAYLLLQNKCDAEDAVHDTFIKIARNIKSIDNPNSKKLYHMYLKQLKIPR